MKRIVLVCLFLAGIAYAQDSLEIRLDDEQRDKMEFAGVFKSSISLELGGKSGFAGVSYDLLLSRKWRLGLGAGFLGMGADIKFHPFGVKRDKMIFNIGLRANAFLPPSGSNYMFYSIPVGITYFTVNRLNIGIDAGPLLKKPFLVNEVLHGVGTDVNYLWFSVKVGYRFSFYAMRRASKLKN